MDRYPETMLEVRKHGVYLRDTNNPEFMVGGELTPTQWKSVQELIREGIENTRPGASDWRNQPPSDRLLTIGELTFSYAMFVNFLVGFAEPWPSRFPGSGTNRPHATRNAVMIDWPAACKLFDVDYTETYKAILDKTIPARHRAR
jgi:hypothetical protein